MAKKWDDLSTEEKARILREYGGEKYEKAWAQANGGKGLTDEQLVNSPVLWPEVNDANGNRVPFESMGDAYISELGAGRDNDSNLDNPSDRDPNSGAPKSRGAVSDITGVNSGSVLEYDPMRGISDADMATYSGVRPGVVLDPAAYERNAVGSSALTLAASERAALARRDAERFAIDANGLPVVDPMMIANPDAIRASTINPEQTNTRGAFDGTQRQVSNATDTVEALMGRSGTRGMMAASDMARAAAEGRAPSAAEQMFLGAGAEAATAYDRIAQQAAIEARNKANALRMQQNAMAAGQRGAVSGLANLSAMNNAALGEAQLYQQALDAQQRASIEATGAMTDSQYKAAATRAGEMADARALYAQIETQLRAGNIQAASELAKLAGITLSAEGQVLGVNQANTAAVNDARTQNVANNLAAQQATAANQIQVGQANAANSLAAQTTNAGNTVNVLQANQNAALGATSQDDAAKQAYDAMILNQAEADRQAAILAQQNKQETLDKQADRLANVYTGNATTSAQLTAAREQADAQQSGALIGTAGAIVGGVIAGAPGAAAGGAGGAEAGRRLESDERSKTVTGPAPTPNFQAAAPGGQYRVAPTAIPQDSGQLANQLAQPSGGWSNMRVSQPQSMRPPPPGSQARQLNAATGNYAPPVPPTDFRRARDERYVYNNDPTKTQYTGPMAQQLPTNVQLPGPNGRRYVDTGRLAMNLASAVGDLQRRLGV